MKPKYHKHFQIRNIVWNETHEVLQATVKINGKCGCMMTCTRWELTPRVVPGNLCHSGPVQSFYRKTKITAFLEQIVQLSPPSFSFNLHVQFIYYLQIKNSANLSHIKICIKCKRHDISTELKSRLHNTLYKDMALAHLEDYSKV